MPTNLIGPTALCCGTLILIAVIFGGVIIIARLCQTIKVLSREQRIENLTRYNEPIREKGFSYLLSRAESETPPVYDPDTEEEPEVTPPPDGVVIRNTFG